MWLGRQRMNFAFSFSSAKQRLHRFASLPEPGLAEHWASLCGLRWCKWQKGSVSVAEWPWWLLTKPNARGCPAQRPALAGALSLYRNSWHRQHKQDGFVFGTKSNMNIIFIACLKKKKKSCFSVSVLNKGLTNACLFLGNFIHLAKKAINALQSKGTHPFV